MVQTVVKMAQKHLFLLRRLKIFGMDSQIIKKLYSCTSESILTKCLVWQLLGI
jgi:hypothetical protein